LGDDELTEYITDIRENKLMFMINFDSCKNDNKCKLKINNKEDNDEFLFYIYYINKTNNILNELSYAKSNKIVNKNIDFDYALKISLRKSEINIFEINSEHKMLCNPEKINKEIYRCLFILINKNDSFQIDKDLIIYSSSTKNDFKMNIYADYINKNEYDN
jgi:hypothetical protein